MNALMQISGSVFHSDLIKMIADEINHILSVRSHNIIERERAKEDGNSEGGSEYSLDEEIIQVVSSDSLFLPF